jgi:hypothetical protein
VGRLLSALVAASVLRRVLRRVAQARVGRRTRLAWRRMARPSLTRSLHQGCSVSFAKARTCAFERRRRSMWSGPSSALSLWRTIVRS